MENRTLFFFLMKLDFFFLNGDRVLVYFLVWNHHLVGAAHVISVWWGEQGPDSGLKPCEQSGGLLCLQLLLHTFQVKIQSPWPNAWLNTEVVSRFGWRVLVFLFPFFSLSILESVWMLKKTPTNSGYKCGLIWLQMNLNNFSRIRRVCRCY